MLGNKNINIKFVQISGLAVSILLFILLEGYLLINKKHKYFEQILNKSEHEVFEWLKQDFNKLNILCCTNSRMKQRFVHNLTLEKSNIRNGTTVIKDESFIKIICPKNIVVISTNEIIANINSLLPQEVTFDFNTQEFSQLSKFERRYKILDNLFIHYQINQSFINKGYKELWVECIQRWIILLSLFTLFHLILFKFYRQKTLAQLADKISDLEITNKNFKERCNSLEGENELISIINAPRTHDTQYKVKITEICRCLNKYFNTTNTSINIKNLAGAEIISEMTEPKIMKVMASIIFYKKSFSKHLKLKIIIRKENAYITILFKDKGFVLLKEKMLHYTRGLTKPYYIMEWVEIFDCLERNNVVHDITYKKKHNIIKIQIPINQYSSFQEANVCYLKDFQQ